MPRLSGDISAMFGANVATDSMHLIKQRIIAPDSSHWAKWIDAALSNKETVRREALEFQRSLSNSGRIPFLSWHHLEELLCIDDDVRARDRIAFIQNLPRIAFMRSPMAEVGLGAITDILVAEAIAATQHGDVRVVRDSAKKMLLRTGRGVDAIGEEGWVWMAFLPEFRARRSRVQEVVAVGGFPFFDDTRTIGEIAKGSIRPRSERLVKASEMSSALHAYIRNHGDPKIADPESMASAFIANAMAWEPKEGMSVRDVLVAALVAQGVAEEEIRDDCLLRDLNALAIFRTKLRVVAEGIGLPFDTLKQVPMEKLPSWVIEHALKRHGQIRQRRPGSDQTDAYLAVLAAYADDLYVDKRTAEDFRRAVAKESKLHGLLGRISKASDYRGLLA